MPYIKDKLRKTLGSISSLTTPSSNDHRIRIGPNETMLVSFKVNGKDAQVEVSPRVTLSDALRIHLGLTGTHIGCEHGVCGMCTVLVNGEAARACLILACQVEGSEITTVEGLGRPDDLHPLQESFGKNHALQCGFCTPGMLMSAYDMLKHECPESEEDISVEMSGVLCRCTGYRNIVKAVSEVSNEFGHEVPAPKNCSHGQITSHSYRTDGKSEFSLEDAESIKAKDEIVLPSGNPSLNITVESSLDAELADTWEVMQDTPTLARCLQGAELIEDAGDDKYVGRIRVALGPIKLAFLGDVHVVERDHDRHLIRALVEAKDQSSGSVQGEVLLTLTEDSDNTAISATAKVFMTGRIAQFGRSLAEDAGRDMFEKFTHSLDAAAQGKEIEASEPPSALSLATQLLGRRLKSAGRLLKRK